jgi:hypothetical protein
VRAKRASGFAGSAKAQAHDTDTAESAREIASRADRNTADRNTAGGFAPGGITSRGTGSPDQSGASDTTTEHASADRLELTSLT